MSYAFFDLGTAVAPPPSLAGEGGEGARDARRGASGASAFSVSPLQTGERAQAPIRFGKWLP